MAKGHFTYIIIGGGLRRFQKVYGPGRKKFKTFTFMMDRIMGTSKYCAIYKESDIA
jgi:hypothetical protein